MRFLTCIGIFLLALIAFFLLGLFVFVTVKIEACPICRAEQRTSKYCFGYTRSTSNQNNCSKWYISTIEPSHRHVWFPRAAAGLNLFGREILHINLGGRLRFLLVNPEAEMDFLKKHFDTAQVRAIAHQMTNDQFVARIEDLMYPESPDRDAQKRLLDEFKADLKSTTFSK